MVLSSFLQVLTLPTARPSWAGTTVAVIRRIQTTQARLCVPRRNTFLCLIHFLSILQSATKIPCFLRHSISFFGETPDKKKVMEFSFGLQKENCSSVRANNVYLEGTFVIVAPTVLAPKKQFLASGKCDNT
jgi:hypothetical protein